MGITFQAGREALEFRRYHERTRKENSGRRGAEPAGGRGQGMGSELDEARAHYGLHVSRPRRLYVGNRDFESVAECHRAGHRVRPLNLNHAVFQKVVAIKKGEGEVKSKILPCRRGILRKARS